MYTDGKEIAVLHRLVFNEAHYQPITHRGHTFCRARRFFEKYPYRITHVEVEPGACKAKGVRKRRLYTDGKEVVRVSNVDRQHDRVHYYQELPFLRSPNLMKVDEFLKRYPWRLDNDSVELVE
jgi:hypothetical protein